MNSSAIHDAVVVKNKGEIRRIAFQDIIYIEKSLRKIFFHLSSEVFCTYGKFDMYVVDLPEEFYLCSRSYIINLSKVIIMKDQTIYFVDGKDIRIGRDKFYGARKAYSAFIAE
ncbi:LytTR family DNA-binding domain-containing protein [Clostridium aminobutyricum]|uniref:LytTR family transcriptional regulator n=1 Tax=Clostridium aminobutyricum TaxID=33953 RepID=A0A939D6T3_CLOAM|nr:LytTR family DNA-binding domain-containing protein [Clostridium aminobutyricum]MBN7772111.1 LytTR family transcriptional regulator [Clostridium aminobutyricum]